MWFQRRLESGVDIVTMLPEHAEQLSALQDACFPTLAEAEKFRARHYLKHMQLFPEGQFTALDGDRVVGSTSTVRMTADVAEHDHTFAQIIEGGYLTSHCPTGEWMYGADIGTHPDHRGRGIARGLYAARQDTVRRLGLKGQMTVGMLRGISQLEVPMSLEEYYERVVSGELRDPTVSMQMHVGFEARGLVKDYISDPVCQSAGARLVLDASKDVDADWV